MKTRERITTLWQLTGNQAGLYSDDRELVRLSHDVDIKYFGVGVPFVEGLIMKGKLTGQFGLSIDQALNTYVPTMATIDRLRTRFLDSATERLGADQKSARLGFLAVSILAAVIVAATLALIVAGRIFVLRPLLMASENVIGLSKGKLEVLASPTSSGEVKRLFNALEDLRTILSQRIEYTEQLKILSETDGLTGLVNRRLFDQIGTGAAEFATFPRSIGLILMDLDWFKRVNDTYGHLVGDLVLKHTASIVRRICRQGDIAARLGGEEIAIIVMDPAPMTSTHAIAECIRAELERSPITLDNGQVFVTASFGVAFGERGPTTWTNLIADADACLYRAKSQGRNRVCSTVDAGSASIAAGLITLQSAAIKAAEAASSAPLVHALEMSA